MLSDRIFHFNAVGVAAFWRIPAAQLIMDDAPFSAAYLLVTLKFWAQLSLRAPLHNPWPQSFLQLLKLLLLPLPPFRLMQSLFISYF